VSRAFQKTGYATAEALQNSRIERQANERDERSARQRKRPLTQRSASKVTRIGIYTLGKPVKESRTRSYTAVSFRKKSGPASRRRRRAILIAPKNRSILHMAEGAAVFGLMAAIDKNVSRETFW
jgi:hypothetical protein